MDQYGKPQAQFPASSAATLPNSPAEVKPDSRASELDSAYMDTMRRGDMETAQRMVREAAV